MRLTEEEMQERRNIIIQTAFRLFCDHGIERITLLEIAKNSGVSESTLYRYFTNKETLVIETFVLLWDTMLQNVEQSVQHIPHYAGFTGYHQMKLWMESLRHLCLIDRELMLFSFEAKLYLLRQHVTLDQLHQDRLTHSLRGPCLAALDKGKADGTIPAKESSEDLFFTIWGIIRGYIAKIVVSGNLYGRDSPWERRYQMMENGILSALSSGWNPPDDGTASRG